MSGIRRPGSRASHLPRDREVSAPREKENKEISNHGGGSASQHRKNISSASASADSDLPLVIFDGSKSSPFTLNDGLKAFNRRLKTQFKVKTNKEELSKEVIDGAKFLIIVAPQSDYDKSEQRVFRDFLASGGSILLLGSEGSSSTLSSLTADFGITFEEDQVVRTVYYKDYFHPKEAFINDAVTVPTVVEASGKAAGKSSEATFLDKGLSLIFPHGTTMHIQRPSLPLISSRSICFPANRPLAAVYRHPTTAVRAPQQSAAGVLVAIASSRIFHDNYLAKEDNTAFLTAVIKILLNEVKVEINPADDELIDQGVKPEIADMESLSLRLKSCLQESEELPADFTTLFDHKMFKFDTSLIPEAVALYNKLNVKHEQLSLIPPQFEVPLPPLQPAVFMPYLREPAPPALDLFDLDQEFATEKLRIDQLTNKCTDKDLEYFVKEAGEILGVNSQLVEGKQSAKHVLEFIFKEVVNYKKMDQDQDDGGGPHLPRQVSNYVDDSEF